MNDNKPVIAVDFDDTLLNFAELFIDFHNRRYGTKVSVHEIIDHGKFHSFFDCDRDTLSERLVDFDELHDYTELFPIEGTQIVIEQLKVDYSLQIVTARQGHKDSPLYRYLSHFFGKETFSKIHFTNSYQINPSWQNLVRTKEDICKSIGASLMIEDAPNHATSVAEAGIAVLMPIKPWNEKVDHPSVTPFDHWEKVPSLIK